MIWDLAAPLVAAVVGGLVVYLLGPRRARYEWRYQKRAEVTAELARLLSDVQGTARLATLPGLSGEVRKARIAKNRKALEELSFYSSGHTLWLDLSVARTVYAFVSGLSQALGAYESEVNKDTPYSPLATRAVEHVNRIVPEAESVLEREFRAILDPPPWWDYPLRALEWLEARNREGAR